MLAGKLDAALDRALAEERIVGAVLMVSERGQRTHVRAVGMADREEGRPMAVDGLFRLASVSKPVMTAVIMSLVEEGRLDLSAPVTRYLPGFRPALPDGTRPEITLHHLLTHTSGLGYRFLEGEDGPYAVAGISDGLDQPGRSMAENLARLAEVPLYFAPGTGWRYSLGIDVAGAAAEAATGMSLQALLDARINRRLGLSGLVFNVAPDTPGLVRPYHAASPAPRRLENGMRIPLWEEAGVTFAPDRAFDADSFASCGAGLLGTAPDLMTFFEAILSGGGPILSPQTVAGMMRNQLADNLFTLHGPGTGFGYGWGILTAPQGPSAHLPRGLLRWGGVYGHSWFMDPEAGRIVLLLTNTSYEGMMGQLCEDVSRAFYP